MTFYDVEHHKILNYSNIVVVRLEISRTYDNVVDYVIRELEIRLDMVVRVQLFLELNTFEKK